MVPLDGVVDAPAGDLDRVERILDVGLVGLAQGPDVEHGGRDQATATTARLSGSGWRRRRRRSRRPPSRAGSGSRSGRTPGRATAPGPGSARARRSPAGRPTRPPPSTTETSSTSGRDAPRAPKRGDDGEGDERAGGEAVLAVAPAQHGRDGVAGERADAVGGDGGAVHPRRLALPAQGEGQAEDEEPDGGPHDA